ncbi:nitroreductase family protein [Methylocystis sp. ATCC 49242]|uniref:nitroreductase family protein n=1 Tax=Methylocystis sp. ATCC 49242 TaxID=622637 RepID=UPI0001F868C9|nr:nitroreductase family protein [Methylocystis sp. ATCC 49242]
MDVLEAISTRRSIRDFLPEAPSRDKIVALIEAATQAPSAVNRQPWSFLVVRDRALLDKISDGAKAFMTSTRPLELPEQLYEKLADPNFHVFYHAPALIVVAAEAKGPWIAEDCALAAENLMIAAHACGLGTCWIGLSQPFLSTREGKQMIGLPETETPFAPIVVGYPRVSAPHPPRKPPRLRWIG